MPKLRIQNLEVCDRPREKFYSRGVSTLSDLELLALAIGRGTKRVGVMELAGRVLDSINRTGSSISPEALMRIEGIGETRASALLAAFEFAKRRIRPSGEPIRSAEDVYNLVRHLSGSKQEHFLCVSLNGEHVAIAVRTITVGLLDRTQVHPREVFAEAIVDRAAAVIVAHNHPSGSLEPSDADIKITRVLVDSGKLLGVPLLDHVIFSTRGYLSLKDRGLC